jgi:rubredoxin
MVEAHSCPVCGESGSQRLESASLHALVDYFRCIKCGHVWNVRKGDDPGKPRHVTPPKEQT